MTQVQEALQRAINKLDGVGKLAAAIDVGQSVVSNWRKRSSVIDAIECVAIERATDGAVRRWELRPDDWHRIWPEVVGYEGAPAVPASVGPAEA